MFATSKSEYFGIFIIMAVFIFSRFLFLLFTPYAYYCEEAKIGSIGHDIVFEEELKLPFWGYLDTPHSGGSVFSGVVAIPFYLIFGDRYLALKMTALVFSLLTLVLCYRLVLSETKGSWAAFFFFMVFFTFATPHYVQKSVILAGNTVELMFFTILIISYFWKIRNNTILTPINYFFLGALCGFSFWVQFMSSYLFLTIIFTLFVTERFRTAISYTLYLLIGFVLGVTPLLIYNLQCEWATLTADARGGLHLLFTAEKFKDFLLIDLPASFHFLDIGRIKSQHFSFFVYGLFVITVLMHLWKKWVGYRKDKKIEVNLQLFLILYIAVFILLTSFTSSPVRSDGAYGWNSMNVHAEYYIVSLQPVIFILFLLLNKYKNSFIRTINPMVSIVFILGYISLFQNPYYNTSLFSPMHSTGANAYECGFNFVRNPKLFLKFNQKISNELQKEYMKGARDVWRGIPQEERVSILKDTENLGLNYVNLYTKLRNNNYNYE